ncbi:MAG: acyltransferase [Rhodobacteraceae bacterium]|nr:acyltransferase [Paracoccaceae bacterium]
MTSSSAHRQGIDLARFLAAFGVVVAHAEASPHDWVGHLSLAMFAILTAFLAVKSAERAGGNYAFAPRARRLILPWVSWSLFYWAVEFVISDGPNRFRPLIDPWSLLYGGFIHLWFLPFIGLAMVLVGPAVRFVTSPQRLGVASALLVALSAPLFWLHEALQLPAPLPQWAFTLPCYALGLLLAKAYGMGRPIITLIRGGALCAMAVWMSQGALWSYTILAGLLAFELFWRLPIQGAFVRHLGQMAFGIYLIHPFLMLVVYKFEGPNLPFMTGAVVDFLLSWAVVAVLRHIPLFARIT